MRKTVACFAILVSSAHALADSNTVASPSLDCPSVDLSTEMGPNRNQGGSGPGTGGICYAMVASDLMSFAQGISKHDPISALDVAARFATADQDAVMNSIRSTTQMARPPLSTNAEVERFRENREAKNAGEPSQALYGGEPAVAIAAYATGSGICRESKLSTQTSEFKSAANKYLAWKIEKLLKGEDPVGGPNPLDPRETQHYLEAGQKKKTPPRKNGGPSEILEHQIRTATVVGSNALPQCEDQKTALKQLAEINVPINRMSLQTLEKKTNSICGNRAPLKPMKIVTDDIFTKGFNPIERIKEAMRNHQPIGVGYDDSFLKQGPNAPKDHNYNHTSSIVGSRIKNGKCEFLLRNSYGIDCEGTDYSDKIFNSHACKNGNIWIPEEDFNDRIQQTISVTVQK